MSIAALLVVMLEPSNCTCHQMTFKGHYSGSGPPRGQTWGNGSDAWGWETCLEPMSSSGRDLALWARDSSVFPVGKQQQWQRAPTRVQPAWKESPLFRTHARSLGGEVKGWFSELDQKLTIPVKYSIISDTVSGVWVNSTVRLYQSVFVPVTFLMIHPVYARKHAHLAFISKCAI